MPSNCLILCHPLLLLPSIFPSIRVFSNESALCIRWPKYCSFSFSISPSSEYSGLISFRMDWFDLLAVQRTLNSLLQNHSSKASILQCSIFFIVQLSHLYLTTEKMKRIWIFVGKVMSLLFNMLSRSVIAFLPRSRHLLISWLQSPSNMIVDFLLTKFHSQSCGFSSSHVWSWELDYYEGRVQKSWCFWAMVLEKTFESPLDSKEIKPVHPKGNQPWIFTEKINAESEASILWLPHVNSWLIGKDPGAGKD